MLSHIITYVIVDRKVHVERLTITKAARVPTSDPARVFSELAKVYFAWAKDFANDFHMRPPRKINVGFAKDSRT